MPRLTQFYGLRPWEVERLTLREVSEYLTQMDRAEEANSGE